MAKARMLHNKISTSLQVNSLSIPAKLLFTWMISHADDDGRLRGESESVKAKVFPMLQVSLKKIEKWLSEIEKVELIYRWVQNNECYIEFSKWKEYQQIRKDRYISSKLPSFPGINDNQSPTIEHTEDNLETPQSSSIELSPVEFKKGEDTNREPVAFKSSFKTSVNAPNPHTFNPSSDLELAVKETWERLEPNNPMAFQTTYWKAFKLGLPAQVFRQFASEIEQDQSIEKKGAVFNSKVEEYFHDKETG